MRLQRRLFLFFLLSGILPLALLALFLWLPLKQQFEIWSLPNVESALEASLRTNRHSLHRHQRVLEDLGQELASESAWSGREQEQVSAGRSHSGVDLAQYYSRKEGGWQREAFSPQSSLDISRDIPGPAASSAGPERSRPLIFRGPERDYVAVPSYIWTETDSGAFAIGCLVLGTGLGVDFFADLDRASEGLVFYRRFADLGRVLKFANVLWVALALAVSSLLAALFARRVARGISQPVETLALGMEAVGRGENPDAMSTPRIPELQSLHLSFAMMREKLKLFEVRLRETERVRATQDNARFVAHEIRNALTPVQAGLSVLQRRVDQLPEESRPQGKQALAMIRAEADRMAHLAQTFSEYAHLPEPSPTWNELHPLLDDLSQEVPSGVSWTLSGAILAHTSVYVDAEDFARLLRNLVKNAVEAMEEEGILRLTVTSYRSHRDRDSKRTGKRDRNATLIVARRDATHGASQAAHTDEAHAAAYSGGAQVDPEHSVVLVLEDNGPGMDPATLAQVWQPGFTTKETGSGLGLSLVRRSIIGYGGQLNLESELGVGTRVTIELPARFRDESTPKEGAPNA